MAFHTCTNLQVGFEECKAPDALTTTRIKVLHARLLLLL